MLTSLIPPASMCLNAGASGCDAVLKKSSRLLALIEGVTVAIIFGSTLVLAKIALAYMGPLTLLALRYLLASLLLLPFVVRRRALTHWSRRLWLRFLLIGLSFYVIGNGAVLVGLKYIPATTGSLLLSFVPLLVLFAGLLWLKEVPTRLQMVGVLIGLVGSALFFSPGLKAGEPLGIGIIVIGLAGNASFGLFGREIAREGQTEHVDTLALTAIPLAFGAAIFLPLAYLVEGFPHFPVFAWSFVLVLTVINTICVYLLYNHALKVLAAFEVSMIINLAPLVTALLSWLFLAEQLSIVQIFGMFAILGGVALVQGGKSS